MLVSAWAVKPVVLMSLSVSTPKHLKVIPAGRNYGSHTNTLAHRGSQLHFGYWSGLPNLACITALLTAVSQGGERSKEAELAEEPYRAAVPLLPARTDASMNEYWRFYLTSVSVIILFGALVAPTLEVKMGLGGKVLLRLLRH